MKSDNKNRLNLLPAHLVDIGVAADHLGVSVFTLRRWVAQRRVPFVRLGRVIRFQVPALEQFIHDHAVETKHPKIEC